MGGVRLRTKFQIAMLLTSAGLTAVTLLIVQQAINTRTRQGIANDLQNSVANFRTMQSEREANLRASARLIANLPILKALMTSRHPPTNQDASADLFQLSGRDLLTLIDPSGRVVGFHANPRGVAREPIEAMLHGRVPAANSVEWWYAGGHLYEVYAEPIYFGPSSSDMPLGIVVVGYEIDQLMAQQVSRLAASDVAVMYGPEVVVSTLPDAQLSEFRAIAAGASGERAPRDISLGAERFIASSIVLNTDDPTPVAMVVMKSYDEAIAFLKRLQRLLLVVGLCAVIAGGVLVSFVARTFTRPLEKLVVGVGALGTGDFAFPILPRGGGEVAELTRAFTRMRDRLRATQQTLIESERLATIGRMAGSISHDLRHPLTAVLANAEFLADSELSKVQREELYQEIRVAVDRLTDLVDSLLELSRPAQALAPARAPIEHSLTRAIELIRTHAEFQKVTIRIEDPACPEALVDARKLERAIYNLVLNSCQAVAGSGGKIIIRVSQTPDRVELRFCDDGPGVDPSIRAKLFQPFVSLGKENGSGLGLTIAQKIVQDHGGSLELESSVPGATVILMVLPGVKSQFTDLSRDVSHRQSASSSAAET
jgi:signal transduction histidine kinase